MAQTPTQRRANEKFASREAAKMGTSRPKMDKEERRKMELADKFKNPPISRNWVYALLFILLGGLVLELLRLFF